MMTGDDNGVCMRLTADGKSTDAQIYNLTWTVVIYALIQRFVTKSLLEGAHDQVN